MNNNKTNNSPKKIQTVEIVSKESKKKKLIRLGALLGAILIFGTFCISLIIYML